MERAGISINAKMIINQDRSEPDAVLVPDQVFIDPGARASRPQRRGDAVLVPHQVFIDDRERGELALQWQTKCGIRCQSASLSSILSTVALAKGEALATEEGLAHSKTLAGRSDASPLAKRLGLR